jgi:hypothetical protein
MEIFILCLLVFLAGINLILAISTSMVLIKIFEISKNQEERFQLEEEARRQARGLMDINTPQVPYSLRMR